jgi:hypothetical protein
MLAANNGVTTGVPNCACSLLAHPHYEQPTCFSQDARVWCQQPLQQAAAAGSKVKMVRKQKHGHM